MGETNSPSVAHVGYDISPLSRVKWTIYMNFLKVLKFYENIFFFEFFLKFWNFLKILKFVEILENTLINTYYIHSMVE
jgi:hypothetical protein